MLWFSLASVVGILWGVVFAFYGLGILPIVTPEALIPWGNGVYGATLIGLCATDRYCRLDPATQKVLAKRAIYLCATPIR